VVISDRGGLIDGWMRVHKDRLDRTRQLVNANLEMR
jgi:hypothetical protein